MRKNLRSLLLACAFLLALTACSEHDSENVQQDQPQAGGVSELQNGDFYLQAYYSTVDPMANVDTITGAARVENCLLFGGQENGAPVLGLSSYSLGDGGRVAVYGADAVALDDPEAEDEAALYGVTADSESFYVLTGQSADERGYQGNVAVLRYSSAGQFLEKRRFSVGPAARPVGFSVGEGGQVALYTMDLPEGAGEYEYVYAVSLYSSAGELTARQVLEDRDLFSWAVRDGGVILSGHDSRMTGYYVRMDWETGTLTELEVVQPEGGPNLGICSYTSCQGLDGEFLIGGTGKFVSYDLDSGACELLLDTSDIAFPQSLYRLGWGPACRLGENTFVCCNGTNQVVVLGMEEKVYQERSVVTVAMLDVVREDEEDGKTYVFPLSEKPLHEANQSSSEYEYQAVHYNLNELDRLRADILAGECPDMILYDGDNYSYPGINTDNDLFDDLYAYIDADETLSRGDFLPNLLEAMSRGGALRRMWSSTGIQTLAAPSPAAGSGKGLTVADYDRIVAENDAYQVRFRYGYGGVELLGWLAPQGMYFVDRENGTCRFDSQEFRDLLAWCAATKADMEQAEQMQYAYELKEVLWWTTVNLVDLPRLEDRLWEDFVFVGTPNGGDGFHNYVCGDYVMAIPARSGNKEGAWAFIRERLSLERQVSMEGLPVIREAIYLSKFYSAASDYAKEQLEKLLDITKYAAGYSDYYTWEIIQEAGGAYLAGDKSLDEAIDLIQSRASLWVAEQYG